MKHKLLIAILLLAPLQSMAAECKNMEDSLRLSLLDVGQGEAILIRCPDKQTFTLIDAGESNSRYPGAEEMFAEALEAEMGGNRKIEYLIATHPDSDHVFGFLSVAAKQLELGTFIDNGVNHVRWNYAQHIRKLILAKKAEYRNAFKEEVNILEICPGISLRFLIPDQAGRKQLGCESDYNNCSLITRLEHGDVSFLLLADAGYKWETMALSQLGWSSYLPSSIIKLGHHGSYSTGESFLEVVKPEYALLSTGKPRQGTTGKYEFPQATVLKRLHNYFSNYFHDKQVRMIEACDKPSGKQCVWKAMPVSRRVLSTAVDGTIQVFTNGADICLNSSRENI